MKKIILLLAIIAGTYSVKAAINQIRWGSSGDPLNGLTVTWSNNGLTDSVKWGYTTSFEKGSFAGTKRSGYSAGISFFKYQFPTVTPSSVLYYKFYDSNSGSWGSQKTFTTAPPLNSTSFTFCSLGDCRDFPATLTTISNLVSARTPALTLFNGDLTLSGTSASQYNTFFTAASNFLANNLVYHAEGNHDAASPSTFSNLWDLPVTNGSNLYYATKYGNAIFITINSCDPTNSAQLTWLQNTLIAAAADPTIMWKVISCHHPFFNTGNHTGDMDPYRGTIWKAFDDYGVDLVFNGHDHNYQRSKPVNLNAGSVGNPVAQYGSGPTQGRCEIISGGAGAGLYSQNTSSADAWAINLFNKNYNYTYCSVQNCKLHIVAYDQNNAIIDSLTLDKTGSSSCNSSGTTPSFTQKFNPISVFPNPVENTFTLRYTSDLTGSALIKIYDMNGKEVASQKTVKSENKMEFKFDMSPYSKGIYTLSVIMGTQRDNAIVILK
jgi:hypothetical protein